MTDLTGFKETEIGPIPVEWEVVRLGEIAENRKFAIVDGPFGSQMKVSEFKDSGVPVLEMEHLKGNRFTGEIRRFISEQKYEELKRSTVVAGDLVISKTGTLGLVAIVPQWITRAVMTSRLAKVSINSKLAETDFVFFALLHLQQSGYWEQVGEGTTMKVLSLRKIAEAPIPLPPLPEQRRIAHVLSTIQQAIAAQDDLIAAARKVKRSLMRHLFTYGPVPLNQADQVPLKETEIGPVPEHWEIVEVGKTGEVITGTTPSTKVPEYYDGPYMFISPGDIGETKYAKQTAKYLSEKGLGVSRALPKDTVLVVCIGATIGKTAMTFADQSATNQQINAIIPNKRVLSHYLYYALSYRSPSLPSLASRAAVPIVNKSNFSKFLIAIPPLPEQEAIAQTLSALDHKIEAEERRKAALQALFKTMLCQLMTGQVRV